MDAALAVDGPPDAPLDAPALDAFVMPDGPRDCAMWGGADCFDPPTTAVVAADYGCALEVPASSASAVTVSGTTRDFQMGGPVADVDLRVFGASFADLKASTVSDVAGSFTIAIPAPVSSRTRWRLERPSGGAVTYYLNRPLDVSMAAVLGYELSDVSLLTLNALPAFIGHARTPGLAIVVGRVLDCDGAPVPGAVATLAASPAAGGAGAIDFVPGAEVYYFVSNLPVRRNQRVETNDDGQFVILEAPIVTPAFVQVWGYTSAGAVGTGLDGLVLLAQYPVELFADAITLLDALPTEGPLP